MRRSVRLCRALRLAWGLPCFARLADALLPCPSFPGLLPAEVGRPLSGAPSATFSGSMPGTGASGQGSSTPAETPAVLNSSASAGSGSEPFSPFGAAAAAPAAAGAAALCPASEPSPFAAAPARAPSDAAANASPFAAGLAPAPSDAANASPFAAVAATRLDSVASQGLQRQASQAPPAAQSQTQGQPQVAPASFDAATNSVLASFARMEQTQRQLSRAASATAPPAQHASSGSDTPASLQGA